MAKRLLYLKPRLIQILLLAAFTMWSGYSFAQMSNLSLPLPDGGYSVSDHGFVQMLRIQGGHIMVQEQSGVTFEFKVTAKKGNGYILEQENNYGDAEARKRELSKSGVVKLPTQLKIEFPKQGEQQLVTVYNSETDAFIDQLTLKQL